MSGPILEIEHLDVGFTQYGRRTQVLRDVNLHVDRGERVALIGQSGSGKTVTMRTVIGTLPIPPADLPRGSVRFEGRELLSLGMRERNRLKGTGISIVLQDPLLSFNPVLTIGRQMDDVVRFADRRLARSRSRRERRVRLVETLHRVQLADAERVLGALPMQLSGGMRQRVLIAMALLNEPSLLIADEPGTALDVTTQQEILNLLNRLVADAGLSLLLITHNLGVVRETADRVYVMHAGRIVESGTRAEIFDAPRDEYTRRLMEACRRCTVRACATLSRRPRPTSCSRCAASPGASSRRGRGSASPRPSRRPSTRWISTCGAARSWASPVSRARARRR